CAAQCDVRFTLGLPVAYIVVVLGPDAIRAILRLRPVQVVSHQTNIAINLGSTSLLFLVGEPHRRERKLLMPPLHGDRITVFGEHIQALTRAATQGLRPGQTLDLCAEFERIALSVITRCIFGLIDEQRAAELEALVQRWAAVA